MEQQIAPTYPESALRARTVGYVSLGFDVDSEGSSVNVSVLDSQPPGVFDEAALAAFLRWKYCPSEYDSSGKTIKLNFDLG